ncbi:MAG: nitrilase-related carbon-nitrogen hydrolase [Pseudophaeobacter sp.]|uniref:nitrilase-related carbon-nitrogen hydrolase n=1 Tax=Pseudophaeobacter sp. TaxID=1971739 RepID=UPI00326614B9
MSSKTIRVAAAQYAPALGDTQANLAASLDWIDRAAAARAELLVLPECCLSGYVFADTEAAAQHATSIDGPAIAAWRARAARHGLTLVAGLIEAADDGLYDSAVVIAPDGEVSTYRKLHLWNSERSLYRPGNRAVVVDTPAGRIGLMICYDLWFPELSRALALAGVQLIACPANWAGNPRMKAPLDPYGQAMGFHVARTTACMNEIPVIVADRVGQEADLTFLGNSCIIAGTGDVAAGPAPVGTTDLLVADIPLGPSRSTGQSHMASRRSDIYAIQILEDLS